MKVNKRSRRLSDDDIVKEIINYVDETLYNYTVMIDGEWGCGKTYFVQERLYKELEDHEAKRKNNSRKILYISLYGIKSLDEVTKQLFMKTIDDKAGRRNAASKKEIEVIDTVLPVLFEFVEKKWVNINLNKITEKLMSIKENILIFDDLERCDCSINEVLGYINTFVEHENMKVIIVANQKEIGKTVNSINQELKYLVAAHDNIIFEKDSQNSILGSYLSSTDPEKERKVVPADINTIKKRIQLLFAQDELYSKIKEKLIGVTIYYQPDLQIIFKELIDKAKLEDVLKKYLYEDINYFEDYMSREGHSNIRTFQFFLSKINQLYKIIIKLEDDGQIAFLKYIMEYTFKICVSFKSGDYKYEWKESEEYKFRNIGSSDIFGHQLSFRFVDDFITKSILEADSIKNMFELYADEYLRQSNQEKKVFVELDSTWYILSDEEIQDKVNIVLEGIKSNKYDFNDYPRIINRFLELQEHDFPVSNTTKMVENMKSSISNLAYRIDLGKGFGLMVEGDRKIQYLNIIAELQKEIDQKFKQDYLKNLDSYLNMEAGWGVNLREYVYHNRDEICLSRGFLRDLNFEKLYKRIEESTSKDLDAFRSCVISLYVKANVGSALEEEGTLLSTLRKYVENVDTKNFDKIKKMQLSYLAENLKNAEKVYSVE